MGKVWKSWASARRTQPQRFLRCGRRVTQPARDGTQTNLSPLPDAAIPSPLGIRQAPTMQQQEQMAAAAACMHAC
eukprot:364349-Chlamydomonas_euryale.AAC.14